MRRVRSPDNKGKFQTDISDSVIAEAMKSVDKATGVAPEEAPPPAEASAAPEAKDDKSALEAALELSQAKGRELMGKVKDEHEKMLRAVADLENYKKRALKEKEEVQRFGIEKLLKDFLPVIDNVDRALGATSDLDSLRKGLEMIRKLFEDTLGKHGVRAFSAQGKPFDPAHHEAMSQAESAELPPNHVVSEVLRGYTLNDRLVRPALVVVSKAPAAAPPPPDEGAAPT